MPFLPPIQVGDLTVHVVCEPTAHSGALYLWFDVGAVDEAADEQGAAHFLEHMLFKGTDSFGVGEAAARIEGMGGDLNAWTSADELVLHAAVPAEDVLAALDVLLEMASRPRFDPEEVERERQVILDEIHGYADDTETVAAEALQASLYGDHPYGRPVLGTERSVAALRREQLVAFHRRHLHPGRAILAVTSPLPSSAGEERVRPWLARWPVGERRQPLPLPTPRPGAAHRVKGDFGGATVQLAVPTVPHGHPDLPALDVLAACLGQGAAALLPEALELESGVASGSWAALATQRAGGALELGFQVGQTEEAVPQALAVLDQVVADGIDGERVARAIDGILCDMRFANETVDGRTSDRVFQLAVHGDPAHAERQRQAIAAVTAGQVQEVARRVLAPEHRHLVVLDPEVRPAKVRAWHSRRPTVVASEPSDLPERHDLGGLTVALLPDGSELSAIQVHLRGGQALEPPRVAGLARAWGALVTRGAGARNAPAFAARTDALAMVLEGYGARASMGLAASLPTDRLLHGLDLVADALVDPHFDPVDVDHIVEEMLDDEAALHDRAATVASEAVFQALFPDHPWGRPVGGTPSSIDRIRPGTVQRFHKQAAVRGNVVIAVAGGRCPAAVLRRLEELAEALPAGAGPTLPGADVAPRPVRPRHGGQTQAAVVAGVRVDANDADRRRALAVLSSILDSQSGRLFMELREAHGLAYGVWAGADVPVGTPYGAFTLGLTSEPSRANEARDALLASWRRLVEQGPSDDEVRRTTRMLAGHVAMGRERVGGRARALLRHVVDGQPYGLDEVRRALLAIDAAALRPLLDELGAQVPAVSVVRPARAAR